MSLDMIPDAAVAYIVQEHEKEIHKALTRQCFRTADEHGWWNDKDTDLPLTPEQRIALIPEKLMLMVTEIAEAMEEYRNGSPSVYVKDGKPEGLLAELADTEIRIRDLVGGLGLVDEYSDTVVAKMAYNEGRSYRHGGKRA